MQTGKGTDMASKKGVEGQARAAIVAAAADLFHLRGVAATSVDDVLQASGTGKSQFYYYFDSKEALVHEALALQFGRYVAAQQPSIDNLGSCKGIQQWLDSIVDQYESRGLVGGCPIGPLAAEMADRDESGVGTAEVPCDRSGSAPDGGTRCSSAGCFPAGCCRDGWAHRRDLRPTRSRRLPFPRLDATWRGDRRRR